MSVMKDGKPTPGTERQKTARAIVMRRRENRRLWKANAKMNASGHSGIYGYRRRHLEA